MELSQKGGLGLRSDLLIDGSRAQGAALTID